MSAASGIIAVGIGIAGSATTAAASFGRMIADANDSSGFPIAQGLTAGGSITVAGVLGWMVVMFKNGQIVGRDTAKDVEEKAELARQYATLVTQHQALLTEAQSIARDYRTLLMGRQGQ